VESRLQHAIIDTFRIKAINGIYECSLFRVPAVEKPRLAGKLLVPFLVFTIEVFVIVIPIEQTTHGHYKIDIRVRQWFLESNLQQAPSQVWVFSTQVNNVVNRHEFMPSYAVTYPVSFGQYQTEIKVLLSED